MVGKVEDFVARRAEREPEEVSPLSKFDRDIIGVAVRFEIPVADAQLHELERIADVLIGAGNNLKFQAQRRMEKNAPSERELKFAISADLKSVRQRIRDLTPGYWNRNGTVKG